MKTLAIALLFPLFAMSAQPKQCLTAGRNSAIEAEARQHAKEIQKELEKNCKPNACTEEQVIQSLYSKFRNSMSSPKAKGYAAVLSVIIGTGAFVSGIQSFVGPSNPGFSVFLGIMTGVILNLGMQAYGAVIMDPITSKTRQGGFKAASETESVGPDRFGKFLERQIYPRIHSMRSTNAQFAGNNFGYAIDQIWQVLRDARENHRLGHRDEVAAQISLMMVRMMDRLYPYLDTTHPMIVGEVRSVFTNYIKNAHKLIPLIEKRIKELDTESDYATRYQPTVEAWFNKD